MAQIEFDIVLVADFTSAGGTGSSLAEEIRIQSAMGMRTGLLHMPSYARGAAGRSDVIDLVRCGAATPLPLDRIVRSKIVILHNPLLFIAPPVRPIPVAAEAVVLVAHQPPRDGHGAPCYSIQTTHARAQLFAGRDVVWSPVSPAVRRQLLAETPELPLTDFDWLQVIDVRRWSNNVSRERISGPFVVGRHSRPDPLKWPDTRADALLCYPELAQFEHRMLGAGHFLHQLYAPVPSNWRLEPFAFGGVSQFLSGLDAYVYFHNSRWVEAFGRNVLEALAVGLPAVLPASFAELFGDAAFYAEPDGVAEVLRRLRADQGLRIETAKRARERVSDLYSPLLHEKRLKALGCVRPRHSAPRKPRVLMMSGNGVGLGHVTRQLAVARHMRRSASVFLTGSTHVPLIEQFGYRVEYCPHRSRFECDEDAWHDALAWQVSDCVRRHDIELVVYDGSAPPRGLFSAMSGFPWIKKIWIRRPMWNPTFPIGLLRYEPEFDQIVEPSDLAGEMDRGATVARRRTVSIVPPVTFLDRLELRERREARRALDIPDGSLAVLVQLGSGAVGKTHELGERVVSVLRRNCPSVLIRSLDWKALNFAERGASRSALGFPANRWARAFDFAVAAAGYNTFHELFAADVPAIWVPNIDPMMDDQAARGQFARGRGAGSCVVAPGDVDAAVEAMLNPSLRGSMSDACRAHRFENGSVRTADLIEECIFNNGREAS